VNKLFVKKEDKKCRYEINYFSRETKSAHAFKSHDEMAGYREILSWVFPVHSGKC
jgi:hypothetical protein